MKNQAETPKLQTAMIMAAGYGTRMGNLTRALPKPLLPLNHLRIIDFIIYKLAGYGIKKIIVNLHYFADKLRNYLGDGSRYGVEMIFSEEPKILGSGGGIAHAEAHFKNETILVVNADVLCDFDIRELLQSHYQANALATMLLQPSRNNQDYMLVLFDQENQMKGFAQKNAPLPQGCQSGIFTGYQLLSPAARAYLQPEPQSIMEKFYTVAAAEDKKIHVVSLKGRWIDIGTEQFYHEFRKEIQSGNIDLDRFMK